MIGPLIEKTTEHRPNSDTQDASDGLFFNTLQALLEFPDPEGRWLTAAATTISEHLDAPSVRLWSLSPSGGRLNLRLAFGIEVPFEALQGDVPIEHSELGRVVTCGTPYFVDCADGSTPPDVREWADREGVSSFAAFPVVSNDKVWGVLGMFTRRQRTDSHRELLSEVSDIIGQAITTVECPGEPQATVDLLSSLVPCLSSAIVTLDRRGMVTRWSNNAEQLFGWSEEEVLNRPLRVVSPERQHEFASLESVEETGLRVNRSRTVCQRADLTPVPIERTTGPLFDVEGRTIGRVEVLADDSQRVQMSRCLQVQGQVAKILAGCRGLDDGLPLLLTTLGEWLACEFVEFWKRQEDPDVLSRTTVWAKSPATREQLAATDIQHKVNASDWPARAHRQDHLLYERRLDDKLPNTRVSSPNLFRIPLASLAIPVYREGHRLGVVICSGQSLDDPDELTQQTLRFTADALAQFLVRHNTQATLAETESNLRQSQKMDAIGLLAGGVAHDFNNLLTIILAYSEMGLEDVDDGHPLQEFFAEIHGAGKRAARMTQQLLAVSRQQPTQPVACNLNHLVEEMDRMLQRLLGANITLTHHAEEGLANIHADVNQMEQVLLNLVVNARDAMSEGGQITVSTRNVTRQIPSSPRERGRDKPFVVLSVTDTGCGMDEATQSRIFEPFFTTKEIGQGTGMGLSTVFGIVDQSGGFIEVESEVNVGTTFSVYLPQARSVLATLQIDDQPEQNPVGTESVLVVENDGSLRMLIRRMLEVRGYTVFEAADGSEALGVMSAGKAPIDLILTSLQIPNHEGVSLSRRLKSKKRSPSILMMSGAADTPGEVECDQQQSVLRKPFTSGELARQVRFAIDSNR